MSVQQPDQPNTAGLLVSITFIGMFVIVLVILFSLVPLTARPNAVQHVASVTAAAFQTMNAPTAVPTTPPTAAAQAPTAVPVAAQEAPQTHVYALKTRLGGDPAMAFVGVGGSIDGVTNPTLTAKVGDTIRIKLTNIDGSLHDIVVPDFNAHSEQLTGKNSQTEISFVVNRPGEFEYYCSIPGHKEIGMKGKLRVTGEVAAGDRTALEGAYGGSDRPVSAELPPAAPAKTDAVSIIRHPSDVPPPVGNRPPMTLRVDMETVEVTGKLADGTTFPYFTFDGTVPGPMLRVRVGDTVEFYLKNAESSHFPHSIDLHAVTGPGGGAVYTQTAPGDETSFTFKALNPGLYVYHCATASIPHHIASGMYGLILVEPEGGLPPVDREFYVMQGEIYTDHPFGTAGHLNFDMKKMSHEQPEYFVFNGAAGGLTAEEYVLRAKVGETVRIYFGVGGPNATSSFHVIGEIFDRVYELASSGAPLTDVQTISVPPGGAAIVEFKVDVPGRYILVDHALSRLERGLAGFLIVEGDDQPAIFHGESVGEAAGH